MQTPIIDIAPLISRGPSPGRRLSFAPFIRFLEKRKEETNCQKSKFFNYVIEQFKEKPELLGEVDMRQMNQFPDQLQMIYNTLSPIIEDEERHLWGLSMPLSPTIFYSTNAFFNLVTDIATGELRKSVASKDPEALWKLQLELNYSAILEKCFHIQSVFAMEVVHSLADERTGLIKYYKMKLDTRFIDIRIAKPFPEPDLSFLHHANRDRNELLQELQKVLPLDLFDYEGFGITTITEVTGEYSIESIKNIIVNHSSVEEEFYYDRVIQSLKTLVGANDIDFGVLPVLKVNNKLVFNDTTCLNSELIKIAKEHGIAEMAYMSLADDYLKRPRLILFKEITQEDEARQPYLKMLKAHGILSYALVPVYFNNSLSGVLEVYSRKKDALNQAVLSRLDPAIPLLSQLLKNTIDEFNGEIDKVIKERFTAIQPSVEWKFNEAAWRYLSAEHSHSGHTEIEEVDFEKVYPLYGAIDIRNSTIERNAALNKDLKLQFTILLDVLKELKVKSGFSLIDEKIFLSQKWMDLIVNDAGFNQEIGLNEFLENDITPFLIQFTEGNQEFTSIVEKYFRAIDEKNGEANENRRQLELSMTTVIAAVNNYLDKMKGEIQQAYPCYFEKFRTDGVEYDIYIGQSIAPDKPYSDIYLKNLRLLQLTSMSAIAKYSHSLRETLARPVETTQLIFIHSHSIDIKFRKDEKRFDVEGAYNIRYHIVKKRIDKVCIRNTRERLTQPGKIALVYFNQKEADEYITYIHYLQGENILNNDLEYLELEELQGISGLKALRVGVNI